MKRSLQPGISGLAGFLCVLTSSATACAPEAGRDPGQEWGLEAGAEAGTESLEITDAPDRGELVISLGSVDLPAHSEPGEIAQVPAQRGTLPFDMMVHGFRVEAVDRDGRPIPHAVLHHVSMVDPQRRELFLPIMRRLFASGQETDSHTIPEAFAGLSLQGGDPFLFLARLFNPTDRAYENVSVRLILSYSRGGPPPTHQVFPFHLDAMFPLGARAFDLPPGKSEKSWEGSPAIPGRILALGGHLHRYAESLTLEDVTEGKVLYRVQPDMSQEGHLRAVPVVRFTDGELALPIDPTHVYRITASYDNPTDEPIRQGGGAAVAGAFIPDDEDAWPAADRADPLFATDYRNVLASPTALGPGLREPWPMYIGTSIPETPPSLPVGVSDLIEFIDHPEEHVLEMVVGPAQLSTAGMHLRLPLQMVELPLDGWLHGFEWEITDADGRKLPNSLLHHINMIDPDRRDFFSAMARRVMGAGAETSGQQLPRTLGYPVDPETRILVSAMFARPTERDYDEVYLHVRLSYTRRGDSQTRPLDVFPFYLDVMGPVGPKSFAIPPGGTVRSWTASPAIDGNLVAIGAHLHSGARYIRLEDLTESRVIWEVEPEGTPGGHVTGVPSTIIPEGIPLFRDHRYRLVVEYANDTDRHNPEPGMGEIAGLILASADAGWPELDRESWIYMADLANTLQAPRMLQGH